MRFGFRSGMMCMAPADEGGGGGGGGAGAGDGKGAGGAPDYAKQIADLTAKNAELDKKIAELSKKPDPNNDPDLQARAKAERDAADKKTAETKALENALRFNMKSEEFLKTNESLLPKDISDIFKQAEKENYSNAVEKDGAIKAGMIQSFFAVQANMDLLTPGLKSALDEYLKLTKNEKQARAQSVYESIFEPAFEMLKRIKKAEALSKGHGHEGDAETAYKNRMIALSKKHYLGEKSNGT